MVIVGMLAITGVLGYIFLVLFITGIFPLIGFDEFNIPAGLALWGLAALDAWLWWILVGQHFSLNVSVSSG